MKTLCVLSAAAVLSASAFAQHAGDVILTLEGGRIVTNTEGPIRAAVFGAEFGAVDPGFTDDPGFDCLPGTFPAGSRIGFRVHDVLREWNGTDFSQVAGSRLQLAFGSTLSVLTPEVEQVVEGFTLSVGSNGSWHKHYEYTLQAPASAGVYALKLTLFGTSALVGESEPFWIIFNQNAQQAEFEAAFHHAEDYFGVLCGDLDFNNDEVFPDTSDLVEFVSVFGGGACGTGNCDTVDFNRDLVFPDSEDLEGFIASFGGAMCS